MESVEPYIAVLFPWFIEMIGIIAFFFITRYFSLFPYTAIMFIIGTFMGIAVNRVDRQDQLSESTRMWQNINSEVLLLVFLPGLIFRDAFSLNVHLFQASFWQCFLMAFPMVLAGTVLIACVAYYIFPYSWPFSLALTFGSILSATDPVAVSSLLGEVGAPPRLKMHISGESLLNDGTHA
jgi:NhaP-type Na+/H+ and K+/H+ antiporter